MVIFYTVTIVAKNSLRNPNVIAPLPFLLLLSMPDKDRAIRCCSRGRRRRRHIFPTWASRVCGAVHSQVVTVPAAAGDAQVVSYEEGNLEYYGEYFEKGENITINTWWRKSINLSIMYADILTCDVHKFGARRSRA